MNNQTTTLNIQDFADSSGASAQQPITITRYEVTGIAPGPIYYTSNQFAALNVFTERTKRCRRPEHRASYPISIVGSGPQTVNVGDAHSVLGILGPLNIENPYISTISNVADAGALRASSVPWSVSTRTSRS